MAKPTGRAIRDELIVAGQELAQTLGVAEFSYADLAERVGIRSASIHHHFSRKEDLTTEMVRRYREDFAVELATLRLDTSGMARLEGYRELFERSARTGRLCLCGSAAAEWSSIGETTHEEVRGFFADQREWLRRVIADGVAAEEFAAATDPEVQADLILAALEGATLLARTDIDSDIFRNVFAAVLAGLQPSS